MPSPTLKDTFLKFSFIKKALHIGIKNDVHPSIFLFLYPFIVIFVLMYTKPGFLYDFDIDIDKDIDKDKNKKISYPKVMLYFFIFQIPLFLYYISIKIC